MSFKKRIACILCALCTIALAFPAFGFAMSGDAEVGRNGKATVKLTIKSELGETEFTEKVNSYVTAWCNDSSDMAGDTNAVVVDSIKSTDSGYVVTVHTRRIDKINVTANMDFAPASEYAVPDSMDRRGLRDFMRGRYGTTITSIKGDEHNSVTIASDRHADLKATAHDASGKVYDEERDVEDEQVDYFVEGGNTGVFESLEKANDNTKITKFLFADIDSVTEATVSFTGKVKFYGGIGAELVDENTIKFGTATVPASIISTDPEKGTYNKDIKILAGWAVVDYGTSPLTIVLATAAAVIVGGGIIAFCIYITKLGKKAIAKEEGKNER